MDNKICCLSIYIIQRNKQVSTKAIESYESSRDGQLLEALQIMPSNCLLS